jgi:hypothetical protein
MVFRFLGTIGFCVAVSTAATAQSPASPPTKPPSSVSSGAGALPEWPATGKPGQKRQYRDGSGRTVIEYYDHKGTKRIIRDSGQNG